MKKIILFAGLGILLSAIAPIKTTNVALYAEAHDCACSHPYHKKASKKKKNAQESKEIPSPGMIGVLSASSTVADTSADAGLTYFLEFNTNFRDMSFSTLDDLGFASQSTFTLSGPGEFLIEASGIITVTNAASVGNGIALSLQFLGTDDGWHDIFPGASFEWVPPFAASAGTSTGFNFSRSIQLINGEVTSFRIHYVNTFSDGVSITNKTLSVTQTQK